MRRRCRSAEVVGEGGGLMEKEVGWEQKVISGRKGVEEYRWRG